jgi:3D (Asp-Asp-Asp) domain-containing protein
VTVPVSFYYCTVGSSTAATGDGGGFCGAMRDGSIVYNGAAACDFAYLGQRFRIDGDPLGLVYKCADTGSAVRGLHRDIWFDSSDEGWVWQRSVGQAALIEILP